MIIKYIKKKSKDIIDFIKNFLELETLYVKVSNKINVIEDRISHKNIIFTSVHMNFLLLLIITICILFGLFQEPEDEVTKVVFLKLLEYTTINKWHCENNMAYLIEISYAMFKQLSHPTNWIGMLLVCLLLTICWYIKSIWTIYIDLIYQVMYFVIQTCYPNIEWDAYVSELSMLEIWGMDVETYWVLILSILLLKVLAFWFLVITKDFVVCLYLVIKRSFYELLKWLLEWLLELLLEWEKGLNKKN
jgi:hypothetical protein